MATKVTFVTSGNANQHFTNAGDISVIGLKLYADYVGTPFISGYFGSRNMESESNSELNFANKFDRNFIHVNSDGFVDEVGDVANLPNYDQCN